MVNVKGPTPHHKAANGLAAARSHLRFDLRSGLAGQAAAIVIIVDADVAQEVGHAVAGDHRACEARRLLQIAGGAGGDVPGAEDDLLRHPAPHAHVQLRQQLSLGDAVFIGFLWQLRHHAQCHAFTHNQDRMTF